MIRRLPTYRTVSRFDSAPVTFSRHEQPGRPSVEEMIERYALAAPTKAKPYTKPETIEKMRAMRRAGVLVPAVAKACKVSEATVSLYTRGIRESHNAAPVESDGKWWPTRAACADDLGTNRITLNRCIVNHKPYKGARVWNSEHRTRAEWEAAKQAKGAA